MILMKVVGIALDTRTSSPIVVLSDEENRRALPIWIGSSEASAIIRQLENIEPPRPMTHDLLYNVIEATGYEVTKIEINDMSNDTYYATIFLVDDKKNVIEVDSRPSDAIAIALRTDAEIYVNAKVIAEGTISTDQERDEKEAEEFRKFIKDIKPSDFQKIVDGNEDSNQ